jgi:hypothetical protein
MKLILDYGSSNEQEFLFGEADDYEYDNIINQHSGSVEVIAKLDHPTEGMCEYLLFESHDIAGAAARDRWKEMAQYDPKEFTCIWALGQYAGPGNSQVSSLDEWLDLWLDTPEEEFASYDGTERDCMIDEEMAEELGWNWNPNKNDEMLMDCVAYRWN